MDKSHGSPIPKKSNSHTRAALDLVHSDVVGPLEKHAEAHTGRKLKELRTDNGGEYLSNGFRAYLADHGIKHQLTVAYTSQQNGVAERRNRT
eukprot:IDg4987t1